MRGHQGAPRRPHASSSRLLQTRTSQVTPPLASLLPPGGRRQAAQGEAVHGQGHGCPEGRRTDHLPQGARCVKLLPSAPQLRAAG